MKTIFKIMAFLLLIQIFSVPTYALDFNKQFPSDAEGDRYSVSSYLFSTPEEDPSAQQFMDATHPVFRNYIDTSRNLKSLLEYSPTIVSKLKDKDRLDGRDANGAFHFFGEEFIPNYALKNEVLENNEVSPNIQVNTSIAGREGNAFYGQCEYEGLDQQDCAEKYGLVYPSGEINAEASASKVFRALPPELIFEYQKGLSEKHEICTTGDYRGEINCSNSYFINKDGESSYGLAREINDMSYDDYKELSGREKQKVVSFNPSHSRIPIMFLIDRHPDWTGNVFSDLRNFLSGIYDTLTGDEVEFPAYGYIWVSQAVSAEDQSEEFTLAQLPPIEGQKFMEDKAAESRNAIDWSGITQKDQILEALILKSEQTQGSLSKPDSYQNLGGYSKSQPSGGKILKTSFQINLSEDPELDEEIYVYEINFFANKESYDIAKNLEKQLERNLPPEVRPVASNTEIPLSKTIDPITATDPKYCTNEGPNGECIGEMIDEVRIAYRESEALEGHTPDGGNAAFRDMINILVPPEDTSRFEKCWAKEYFQKHPAAQKIIESMDVFNLFDTTSCPDELAEKDKYKARIDCDQADETYLKSLFNQDQIDAIDDALDRNIANCEGDSHFDVCGGTVVKVASQNGINPIFALAIWMLESSASNYACLPGVEDFGIHTGTNNEPQNFSVQLEGFINQKGNIYEPVQNECGGSPTAFALYYNQGVYACTPSTYIQTDPAREYVDAMEYFYSLLYLDLPSNLNITSTNPTGS